MHSSQKLVEADLDAAIASNQERPRRDCPLADDGMPELRGWHLFACVLMVGAVACGSVFLPWGFLRP